MESNKETYVTFEQAQALKRLGFDWECATRFYVDGKRKILAEVPFTEKKNFNSDGWYITVCSAPALHIAAKWLREVKRVHVYVRSVYKQNGGFVAFVQSLDDICCIISNLDFEYYKTYEKGLSEGITAALKYLEEQ